MSERRQAWAAERLKQVRRLLRGSHEMAKKTCAQAGNLPVPGCPAEREWEGGAAPLADESKVAHLLANLRHTAATDCLEGLWRLWPEPTTQFSVMATARSAIELSTRGSWLLEPGLDCRERAGRSLADRMWSASQAALLEDETRTTRTTAETGIVAAARALGFAAVEPPNARKPVRLATIERPSNTSLWVDMFGPLGRELYAVLSAAVHGTEYSLLDAQGPVGRDLPAPFLRHDRDFPWMSMSVALTILSYLRTFERQIYLLGWPTRPYLDWREEVWQGLQEWLIPPSVVAETPSLPGWEGLVA